MIPFSPRTRARTARVEPAVQVIGAGYVGLVTAACLASLGHAVRCVDLDRERVANLENGDLPFQEPELQPLVTHGQLTGRLSFSSDTSAHADITFVAVGTLDRDGRWTDRYVRAAVESALASPQAPRLLVVRSTLRPGLMRALNEIVERSGRQTTLLLNPEFTKEGTAVHDFLNPDRVVIGIPPGASPSVADPLRDLYRRVDAPVLVTDHTSAELIKIASNAFLATKITFANELARFCRELGGDMLSVREGIGLDTRIGTAFLRPGPGFGGSCLPSQVDLLVEMSNEFGLDAELLPAVARLNRQQPRRIATQVIDQSRRERPKIALLGLSFKAGTDDVRESPALALLEQLQQRGACIRAYDPLVREIEPVHDLTPELDLYDAVVDADVIVVATEWPEFRNIDWRRVARIAAGREVFDARRIVDVAAATQAGFRVRSLEHADAEPCANQSPDFAASVRKVA